MILYDQELPGGYVDKKFIAEESDFELEAGKGRRLAAIRCLRHAFLGSPVYDFKYRNPALTKYEMRDAEVICASFGVRAEKLVAKMARIVANAPDERRDGEYLAIRDIDQYGNDRYMWVEEGVVNSLLNVDPVHEPRKETGTRASRHWLLSTKKTASHFGFPYSGRAFDFNRDWNKTPNTKSIYKLFAKTMYDVLIPNALVAKDNGKRVSLEDFMDALSWVFRGHEGVIRKAFRESGKGVQDFRRDSIDAQYAVYVRDFELDRDGKVTDRHTPPGMWWTVENYSTRSRAGYFLRDMDRDNVKESKPLKRLKEAFLANREIGSWSSKRICSELKVSARTVVEFHKILEERRKKWADSEGAFC